MGKEEVIDPEEEFKKGPPHNNAFQQQRLPHFSPQHRTETIIVSLLVVTILFIPLGAYVLVDSDAVIDINVRYDHIKLCTKDNHDGVLSVPFNGTTYTQGCRTRVKFTLDKAIAAPIYMYYRLVGFYQNFRLYVKSRSDLQNEGNYVDDLGDLKDCVPFRSPGEYLGNEGQTVTVGANTYGYNEMRYAPCGSIAWSMFNDSFTLYRANTATIDITLPTLPAGEVTPICYGAQFDAAGNPLTITNCEKKGIAMDVDVNYRHKRIDNPPDHFWTGAGNPNSTDLFHRAGYYHGEPGHKVPLIHDEDFMVWARIGSLADFRKLYRKINTQLPAGTYVIDIQELFDTSSFGGEKYVVLGTRGTLGGTHYVLGICFLILGCLAFVQTIGFTIIHFVKKNKQETRTTELE